MASPRLGDPGVVPRKNGGCEYAHHLENGDCLVSRVYIYVCLAASSNKRMFLREELTSLPKWFARRVCLPIVNPQPTGALHAFGRVWE